MKTMKTAKLLRMFIVGATMALLGSAGQAQIAYLNCEDPASQLTDQADGSVAVATGAGQTYGIPSAQAGAYGAITLTNSLGAAVAISGANTGAWDYSLADSTKFCDLSNDYTLMAWIYVPPTGVPVNGDDIPILGGDETWNGFGFEWGLSDASTSNSIMITTWGIEEFLTPSIPFQLNAWQHIAVIKSGTAGVIFYYNGVSVLTNATSIALQPNNVNASDDMYYSICRSLGNEAGDDNFNNGLAVDEVRVYDTVLSPAQIIAAASSYVNPGLPFVVRQPQSVTNFPFQPITLTAAVFGNSPTSGNAPVTNQWYEISADGTTTNALPPGPEGTNATLSVTSSATTNYSGTSYFFVASTAIGSVTSQVATVSVLPPEAPVLVQELIPSVATEYLGGSVTLNVQIDPNSTPPLTFLWQSNDVVIAITTNVSSYALTNLQYAATNGTYSVTVTNALGTTNSTLCAISILPPPPAESFPAVATQMGPLAYWRLGEPAPGTNAFDYWGGHLANYVNALQHQLPGAILSDDDGCVGVTGSDSYVQAQESLPFVFSGTNAFTLAGWVNLASLPAAGQNEWVFSNRQGPDTGGTNDAGYAFGIIGLGGSPYISFEEFGEGASGAITYEFIPGTWYFLVAVRSGVTTTVYINGAKVYTYSIPTITGSTEPLQLSGDPDTNSPAEYVDGEIDEALVFSYALTTNQIQELYQARFGATTAPIVTQAPLPATIWAGGTAVFQVEAAVLPMGIQQRDNLRRDQRGPYGRGRRRRDERNVVLRHSLEPGWRDEHRNRNDHHPRRANQHLSARGAGGQPGGVLSAG